MALHWNLEGIADYRETCLAVAPEDRPMDGITKGDLVITPRTHAMIFMTMAVGMGSITAKNWRRFYARARIIERLDGAYYRQGGEDMHLTPADVKAYIGLSTNVSTETDAQWFRRVGKAELARGESIARDLDAKAAEATAERGAS